MAVPKHREEGEVALSKVFRPRLGYREVIVCGPLLALLVVAIADRSQRQPTDVVLAYIDPGSGNVAYQLILAGLLGIVFAFRRLLTFLRTQLSRWRASGEPGHDSGLT